MKTLNRKQGAKQSRAQRYLSGQHAEEDEEEHALKGVADGEQVGSQGGLVEDVQHPEGPGDSQHEEQGHGTTGAGPAQRPKTARSSRCKPHPSLPLTFCRGAHSILPDVFVVAGFGFFHGGVSVHFVDDHSERQEINLQGTNETDTHGVQGDSCLVIFSSDFNLGKRLNLTRMMRQAGPMKLHTKWCSVLNQQLEPTQSLFLLSLIFNFHPNASLTIATFAHNHNFF